MIRKINKGEDEKGLGEVVRSTMKEKSIEKNLCGSEFHPIGIGYIPERGGPIGIGYIPERGGPIGIGYIPEMGGPIGKKGPIGIHYIPENCV